jgi:hypothetical protein
MKGGDRRVRRPGAVVLALLFGTTAAALALTLVYHLGVPGLVVTLLLGLPGLYLGWVALRDARRSPDRSLAEIADGLAARLRHQWSDEAEVRGLNAPYPLPVTWTAGDPPLAGDLDALKRLAASGAGYQAQGQEHWASGPEDLASGDRKLADVLAAVPTGRLVVLGEPGTGKTTLMVGLVLDLLHSGRRGSGAPVPVLATLASWDPVNQDLHGWLGATLITAYPDLAAAPPIGSAGRNRFEALLEAGLILPVLDGLDEIPESVRPVAITQINKQLKPGEQMVITCRTEQYKAAVSPPDGQGVAMRAAVVQLSPLEFGEVAGYLRQDAGPAKDRWNFLDALSAGSPLRQALRLRPPAPAHAGPPALLQQGQERVEDAHALLLRVMDMQRSLLDTRPEWSTVLANALALRVRLLIETGAHASVEEVSRELIDVRRTLVPANPGEHEPALLHDLEVLVTSLVNQDRYADALPPTRAACELARRLSDAGAVPLPRIAGDVILILIFVPGTFNDAGEVAVLGADQGDNPPGGAGRGDPRGDDGEPLLLRLVQRRPDDPGHPVGSRRLDSLRSAPAEQLRADLVPVPLRVRDMGGQPVRELFLVCDRALAEPEVTADLGTVVLQRAAVGPFVEPQVRRRDLHLPGNELNRLVRQLRPSLGEPPVLGEELQQQREP